MAALVAFWVAYMAAGATAGGLYLYRASAEAAARRHHAARVGQVVRGR